MFAPYYFNAYMSFQMTGVKNILVGPSDPNTLQPDVGKILLFIKLFIIYLIFVLVERRARHLYWC